MISTIKNGYLAGKSEVVIPHSRFKEEILRLLVRQGYLAKVEIEGKLASKRLIIQLAYENKKPVLSDIKMISKPGLRIYKKYSAVKKVGIGLRLVTTSKGIMTDREALKQKLGGELVLEVF